jgi:superfamily I DNA/RNA helicase
VLAGILPDASLSINDFDFDYDRAAEEFLQRQDVASLLPRCTALFIDAAQDMGPSTLRLLLSIVEQTDEGDPNSRPAHIFFDNAQNVYGRKTAKWTEFGLDMRGRSTILRESFRSTKPIMELAVNVLQRLSICVDAEDQNELAELGLIEIGKRDGRDWLSVNFCQVDGPKPIVHLLNSRAEEIERIAQHLKNLIQVEQISPQDICLLYVGEYVAEILSARLGPVLESYGVELSVQKNRSFERRENTLLVTTPHSYKGYESEVVLIPCVDQYVSGEGQTLANPLYVAMTRARSLLAIYGQRSSSTPSHRLVTTLEECTRQL